MTATITVDGLAAPVDVTNEATVRAIVVAKATGEQRTFRIRSGRRDVVKFTTARIEAIHADGVDFTDYASPVSYGAEQVAA